MERAYTIRSYKPANDEIKKIQLFAGFFMKYIKQKNPN